MKFLKKFFDKWAAEAARLREQEKAREERQALEAEMDACKIKILDLETELAIQRLKALGIRER